MISSLMQFIRAAFYQQNPDWYKDQHFIRQRVVTFPAQWLNSRGVTLRPERYKEVMMEVFRTIKLNGNTDSVQYWPRYLLHCVQEHLKHHGESLYDEGKSLRSAIDLALTHCEHSQVSKTIDTVAVIAQVNRALATNGGRKKKSASVSKAQLSLF